MNRLSSALEIRINTLLNKRRGWRNKRKIVVIESDDWGSIRMPNRETYDKCLEYGIRVDNCSYCKYDTIASIDDFDALFNVLRKHRDKNGKHPVITANSIMANPDFAKIRASNFESYFFEPFTNTINKYPNRSFKMWQEGINEGIFSPQLHGREHLNVTRWLEYLNKGSKELHFAFNHNFFGISTTASRENNPSFLSALDYDSIEGKVLGNKSLGEAVDIFTETFQYKPESFIGPNYYWHDDSERVLSSKGIKYLQGSYAQKLPHGKIKYHYCGEINKYNQIYTIRNVIFEPSSNINKDWVNSALKDIKQAFILNKPAIISIHRVAFIGAIVESNRTQNLALLNTLLAKMLSKWPEIEFMTSNELGELISKEKL